MAAVFASKGHTVIGVDSDPRVVEAINQGRAPVEETGLQELITANRERISATLNCVEAVAATEATFVIVPTPSKSDGTFDLKYVMEAARGIGAGIKETWHLVVLCSTVMPEGTEWFGEALEQFSGGRRPGIDFGLCYNPEFIALGSVIHDLQNPDLVLIGESEPASHAGDVLERFSWGIVEDQRAVSFQRMSYVNAELTKLSINTFVTTKISYANMLSEVCDRIPGADAAVVTRALGCDSRIGSKYLKPGLGYGGPCFPRDNKAFMRLAQNLGVKPSLPGATDEINNRQVDRIVELVLQRLPMNGKVAILGLSYKPDTGVVENSQGMALCKRLAAAPVSIQVYEPSFHPGPTLELRCPLFPSQNECVQDAAVVVIMTAHDEFRSLSPKDLKPGAVVIDPWRILKPEDFPPGQYLTLGVGHGSFQAAFQR